MVTWQEKRADLMEGLCERRQRVSEAVTIVKWTGRVYSLPVLASISPELGTELYLEWFGPVVAEATATLFKSKPEALRTLESLQLSVGQQEWLRELATGDLFLPVLAGTRAAMRERDAAAAVTVLAKTVTEEQAEAAIKEGEKILDDPVASAGILKIEELMAGQVDFDLPDNENLPAATRERQKHLLFAVAWFFMTLFILQGITLALPESAQAISDFEQHFGVALELSSIALYLHNRKWRDRP